MKPDVILRPLMPYYMAYKANAAVVYKRTWLGTDLEVARFTHGVDAIEYVEFKNKDQKPIMVKVAA